MKVELIAVFGEPRHGLTATTPDHLCAALRSSTLIFASA
jgi:hypothetical protein